MMLQSGEIRGVGKEDEEDDGVKRSISIRELGVDVGRKGKEGRRVGLKPKFILGRLVRKDGVLLRLILEGENLLISRESV